MRKYEFEWSFFGFIRILVPVLVYLMCFVTIFKVCLKLCKRRRNEGPPLQRVASVPSHINLAQPISARSTHVVIPIDFISEIVPSSVEGVRQQQQQPAATDLESQNPPSYEEVTSESYSQKLPAYSELSR
ncbi:uncharacterized protein LOC119770740 [Culex quinquefasciatus]|uniref:uncharacterized protein LOC119770740 n=1 Tax=Culex quinquefasciatus TaxID=7176 RepID=UPI0018E3962A|nr:uncharacterized protein LOC119770740 [Culex quinquefasciatus]